MASTCATCEGHGVITVCDSCGEATCWRGEFYCDNFKDAGTKDVPCPACNEGGTVSEPTNMAEITEPSETTFPTEALARLRAKHTGLIPPPPENDRDEILRDAMAVIEHQESDYKALTNTVDFMRDRVRAAIEPR